MNSPPPSISPFLLSSLAPLFLIHPSLLQSSLPNPHIIFYTNPASTVHISHPIRRASRSWYQLCDIVCTEVHRREGQRERGGEREGERGKKERSEVMTGLHCFVVHVGRTLQAIFQKQLSFGRLQCYCKSTLLIHPQPPFAESIGLKSTFNYREQRAGTAEWGDCNNTKNGERAPALQVSLNDYGIYTQKEMGLSFYHTDNDYCTCD